MNEELYRELGQRVRKYKHGEKIIIITNKVTTSFVYAVYPIILLIMIINNDSRFWKVLIGPGISFVLLSVFRNCFNAKRPYELYNIEPIINKDSEGKSFPSRHVFSVFIIAMTLSYISIPLGTVLFTIGSIIAIIRVLGGVHFPKDVIVGAITGVLLGIIFWNINFLK